MERSYQVWVDKNGKTKLTLVNTADATPLNPDPGAAIRSALLAKSNAAESNHTHGPLVVGVPVPLAGVYQQVLDVANLYFLDAGGFITRVVLPAPLSSIFLADQETVDITQIGAIISAVLASGRSAGGLVLSSYVNGTRQPYSREAY